MIYLEEYNMIKAALGKVVRLINNQVHDTLDSIKEKINGPYIPVTIDFAKSAGYISGALAPLTSEKEQQLLNDFDTQFINLIEQNINENIDSEKKNALINYARSRSLARHKNTAKDIQNKAQLTIAEINDEARLHTLPLADLEKNVNIQLDRNIQNDPLPNEVEELFSNGKERLYYSLQNHSISAVEPSVKSFLSQVGYDITDYAGGYATNDGGKNIHKIGKILQKQKDKAPAGLLTSFQSDPCRIQKSLMVVLTRNPIDIARGSYGRGWQSCRSSSHGAANNGVQEYRSGVIAAYLVSEDDPDIHNPLGRLFLKPFEDKSGNVIYLSFNPIGLHVPAFVDAVNKFADQHINKDKYGTYHLRSYCESFREKTKRTRLAEDPVAALKQVGVNFQQCEGKIIINEDLNLSGLGLNKLPDLKDVILKGGLNISDNKLLSLEGLPNTPINWLNARGTLISSFIGCSAPINGQLSYDWSAYLVSTEGIPKAREYKYGGGFYDYNDTSSSSKPACPITQPSLFPRFARK